MEEKNYEVNKKYDEKILINVLKNFDKNGEYVVEPGRNEIKKFEIDIENNFEKESSKKEKHNNKSENLETKKMINIKKFKQKDFITNFFYKFKGSKAKRSYEYAKKLLEYKIKTPEPIAYFDDFVNENNKKNSYYISEELKYDFTCREVFWPEDIERDKAEQGENYKISEEIERMLAKVEKNREKIIRQFAKFSFDLHENGVEFEDYSPGNVLIKDKSGNYEFYLVDLNRMKFGVKLNLDKRMKNVSRMMEDEKIARIFSNEYAKYCKQREELVFRYLRYYIRKHKSYVYFKDITRPVRNVFKKKK
ncbi:hypothetical protein [Leptotrichia hongkongensis]|uniref:hypothetical protein n=1 Tax=Leptotrichia hongkongensis TaxID=554406 RepID=UPI0035A9AAC5